MDRNWLIRTHTKNILGPLKKSKVLKLIQENALTGEDEVSSGNGHWFWIREKDLVEKYLYGDEEQPFNPISEAENIFGNNADPSSQKKTSNIESVLEDTLVVKREAINPKTKKDLGSSRSEIKGNESKELINKKSYKIWIIFAIYTLIFILSVAMIFFLRPLL